MKERNRYSITSPSPPLIDNWQVIIKNKSPPYHLIINTYNKILNYEFLIIMEGSQ